MYRDFPFNIREVAGILGLNIRYDRKGSSSLDVDCPFCNKECKMNLNTVKNVYRCNYCGEYGGMIQLFGKVHGYSNSDAYKEICDLLNREGTKPAGYGRNTFTQANAKEPCRRADANTIHQTYSTLLTMLALNGFHNNALLSRGLSPDAIIRHRFKSTQCYGQQELCTKLLQAGCTLDGVPGFYKINDDTGTWHGKWSIRLRASGILIPVCGLNGKIAAIQIRLDRPINKRKYIWLSSSDMDGGTSTEAPIHFVGDQRAKKVFVTEGSLKGTIAHNLSNYTFVCIPGANSIGNLDSVLQVLKANGTTEIVEALDMDKVVVYDGTGEAKVGNVFVAEAARKLREKISAFGFRVTSAEWTASINGIDDYLLYRKNMNHSKSIGAIPAA